MRYIEVDSLINEYITDNEITGKTVETLLRRWFSRGAEMIVRTECQNFRVAIIDIKKHVGELPEFLHSIFLAGAFESGHNRVGREEMRKWVYDVLGTDCEVEVKLNCPECDQQTCNHSTPIVELEMDRIYREERPYLTAVNDSHFIGYSANTTDGMACMDIAPKFHVMRPKITDTAWWNSEYYLGVCNALGPRLHHAHTYHLEDGKFITTMKEGQVVVSYLANKRDANGYFLIPDTGVVIEALEAFVDYKFAARAAKYGNQTDSNYALNCERKWRDLRADAINELEMPSSETWEGIINKYWIISPDKYHYGCRTHR